MSILEYKLHIKDLNDNDRVYECNCYTTTEEARPTYIEGNSVAGSYMELKNNNVKSYIGLMPKDDTHITYKTPLTIKKNGVEYYAQTAVVNSYAINIQATEHQKITFISEGVTTEVTDTDKLVYVNSGSAYECYITADPGYTAGYISGASASGYVLSNMNISSSSTSLNTYLMTIIVPEGIILSIGGVNYSAGTATVSLNYGDIFTVTPSTTNSDKYYYSDLTMNGQTIYSGYQYSMPAENVTVTCSSGIKNYTCTISMTPGAIRQTVRLVANGVTNTYTANAYHEFTKFDQSSINWIEEEESSLGLMTGRVCYFEPRTIPRGTTFKLASGSNITHFTVYINERYTRLVPRGSSYTFTEDTPNAYIAVYNATEENVNTYISTSIIDMRSIVLAYGTTWSASVAVTTSGQGSAGTLSATSGTVGLNGSGFDITVSAPYMVYRGIHNYSAYNSANAIADSYANQTWGVTIQTTSVSLATQTGTYCGSATSDGKGLTTCSGTWCGEYVRLKGTTTATGWWYGPLSITVGSAIAGKRVYACNDYTTSSNVYSSIACYDSSGKVIVMDQYVGREGYDVPSNTYRIRVGCMIKSGVTFAADSNYVDYPIAIVCPTMTKQTYTYSGLGNFWIGGVYGDTYTTTTTANANYVVGTRSSNAGSGTLTTGDIAVSASKARPVMRHLSMPATSNQTYTVTIKDTNLIHFWWSTLDSSAVTTTACGMTVVRDQCWNALKLSGTATSSGYLLATSAVTSNLDKIQGKTIYPNNATVNEDKCYPMVTYVSGGTTYNLRVPTTGLGIPSDITSFKFGQYVVSGYTGSGTTMYGWGLHCPAYTNTCVCTITTTGYTTRCTAGGTWSCSRTAVSTGYSGGGSFTNGSGTFAGSDVNISVTAPSVIYYNLSCGATTNQKYAVTFTAGGYGGTLPSNVSGQTAAKTFSCPYGTKASVTYTANARTVSTKYTATGTRSYTMTSAQTCAAASAGTSTVTYSVTIKNTGSSSLYYVTGSSSPTTYGGTKISSGKSSTVSLNYGYYIKLNTNNNSSSIYISSSAGTGITYKSSGRDSWRAYNIYQVTGSTSTTSLTLSGNVYSCDCDICSCSGA